MMNNVVSEKMEQGISENDMNQKAEHLAYRVNDFSVSVSKLQNGSEYGYVYSVYDADDILTIEDFDDDLSSIDAVMNNVINNILRNRGETENSREERNFDELDSLYQITGVKIADRYIIASKANDGAIKCSIYNDESRLLYTSDENFITYEGAVGNVLEMIKEDAYGPEITGQILFYSDSEPISRGDCLKILAGEKIAVKMTEDKVQKKEALWKDAKISFFVSEFAKAYDAGEHYDNIKSADEAIAIFKQLVKNRTNGRRPCIGIMVSTPNAGEFKTDIFSSISRTITENAAIEWACFQKKFPKITENENVMKMIRELEDKLSKESEIAIGNVTYDKKGQDILFKVELTDFPFLDPHVEKIHKERDNSFYVEVEYDLIQKNFTIGNAFSSSGSYVDPEHYKLTEQETSEILDACKPVLEQFIKKETERLMNTEPMVQVIESNLRDINWTPMPLSEANEVHRAMDSELSFASSMNAARYMISYVKNGELQHYANWRYFGDKKGSLLEHLKESSYGEFVTYLEQHLRLNNMEKAAETLASTENANALKEYVKNARTALNNNGAFPELPEGVKMLDSGITRDKVIHEITIADELVLYQKQHCADIQLNRDDAQLLLNYLEGHDYTIGVIGGQLYRGDLAEIRGEVVWEEYSLKEVILTACEWNNELLEAADETEQNKYESLKKDEQMLGKLSYGIFNSEKMDKLHTLDAFRKKPEQQKNNKEEKEIKQALTR